MIYIFLVIAILLLIMFFMLKPAKATKQMRETFAKRNYAHRGLYSIDQKIPENSLAAFEQACKKGYGIELDIQLSKDGQIVVFHDDRLERMCGVKGNVCDYDYAELQSLSLKETNEKIPLFSQVLELVNGRSVLIVEFKSCKNYPELCEKASKMLKEYKGDFCVESFDPRLVMWFKKHQKGFVRGQLANPAKMYTTIKKPLAICLANGFTNFLTRPHFIAYSTQKSSPFIYIAEAMGAMTVAWTVKPQHDASFFEETNDCVIFEHYLPTPKFEK